MDTKKVGLGLALLLASTAIIFSMSVSNSSLVLLAGGLASLGMAAGSLLVGTSGDGRPV